MRAGDDDGLWTALHEIGECRGRVCHGVRTVADDKSVVSIIILLDGGLHEQPMRGQDVRAVDVAHLQGVRMAKTGDRRDRAEDLIRTELRNETVCGAGGRDGTARAEHQDTFHTSSNSFL